jgi:hypothetical protein
MASKAKKKTFSVWRWYRVAMSSNVEAENVQEAAQKLSEMKYDDFNSVEDTESTDEVSIFSVTN